MVSAAVIRAGLGKHLQVQLVSVRNNDRVAETDVAVAADDGRVGIAMHDVDGNLLEFQHARLDMAKLLLEDKRLDTFFDECLAWQDELVFIFLHRQTQVDTLARFESPLPRDRLIE